MDISSSLASLMSVKDESEVNMMKRAASITLEIYSKVFKENIKDIIDADKVRILHLHKMTLIHLNRKI